MEVVEWNVETGGLVPELFQKDVDHKQSAQGKECVNGKGGIGYIETTRAPQELQTKL
jgi:hypothetical protein